MPNADRILVLFVLLLSGHTLGYAQCGNGNPSPVYQCIDEDDDDGGGGGGLLCQLWPDFCNGKMNKDGAEDCQSSPIVIDMLNNGFQFSGPRGAIWFDLHGLGQFIHITWVLSFQDDYFLVQDINGNGVVDDGSELFGNGTRMLLHENYLAPNGFVGLAQYDNPLLGGNGDLYITEEDEVWKRLYLWKDGNADGHSTKFELLPIRNSFLQSIYVIPNHSNRRDEHGNHLKYWSTFSTKHGTVVPVVDVFFVRLD